MELLIGGASSVKLFPTSLVRPCLFVTLWTEDPKKHQRGENKAKLPQSEAHPGVALFKATISSAMRHKKQKVHFPPTLLIDMFSYFASHSPNPIYFLLFLSHLRIMMMVSVKEVVISCRSTSYETLVYSGGWGVRWKPASFEKIGCRQPPHFSPSSW